jgi:hypothetical protein
METFTKLERVVMQWLVQSYQRRALRRAVRHAYQTFARRHPNWVAALFDDYFVRAHLLPMLQSAAEHGEPLTPNQVADQWAQQISTSPARRQQHSARIAPAATRFLCMVTDELNSESVYAHAGRSGATLIERVVGS